MNETWEIGKKINFRTHFGSFAPNLGPQSFIGEFYLY